MHVRFAALVALLALAAGTLADEPGARTRVRPGGTWPSSSTTGSSSSTLAGPGEVFASAGGGKAFRVYTVAASRDPVSSQGFFQLTPEFTLADCPKPDVIVLPGGATGGPLMDPKVIDWIKATAADAEVVQSVCTGAFLLAKAGLLDGKEATTHWGSIDRLRAAAPKATVHADRRVVDNAKVVTAAGVSAGIDASLHVVGRLLGEQAARDTARYME